MREGSPIFPYLMAGVGYPGLFLVTLFFVWRFLSSVSARSATPAAARVVNEAELLPEPAV